ncbi:MAG: FAD-binding oxidoreductase, partial [Parvularculaceae bacterium]|nr:FAD-binding oxidoreductase [Parvularculaceae bacterium]
MKSFDVVILGAGIAGASLAASLAGDRDVVIIEIEDHPGRHATGRSAAMFAETYGNRTIRALTRASRRFLLAPPSGFAGSALLSPRAALFVCDAARLDSLDREEASAPDVYRRVSGEEARAIVPIMRPDWCAAGLLDSSGFDIDVAALLQGFLKAAKREGASVALGARETRIARRAGEWVVSTALGDFAAPILVNATGAWGDETARAAGVAPVGLAPKRRTAMTLAAPEGMDIRAWPLVIDVEEEFYFKPDAGQILLSPANEDPEAPCDAAPDDLDIAIAVDRFERATTHSVSRINHRWAGLRTFAADRSPVIGFDPNTEDFFWLVGQGGYGIQTAPAAARAAASMILGRPLPDD